MDHIVSKGNGTIRGIVYNLLVRTTTRRHKIPYRWFWGTLQHKARSLRGPVRTRIHRRNVIVNYGYSYPFFARDYPSLNAPLLELVNQTFRAAGRPLTIVDVGAAVGDTVLLIDANCTEMVSRYICIDGDPEFFSYLTKNLQHLPNCKCLLQQLSAEKGLGRGLIRTHPGTASAQGSSAVGVASFDDVIQDYEIGAIDVLKVDVDGYDGQVLAGAAATLGAHLPAVIFEWHPKLCAQTGNDASLHFSALIKAGYDKLLWFTKYGEFSHFGKPEDGHNISRLQQLAIRSEGDADLHFDVVALPSGSLIDEVALSDLQFAKNRISKW